MSRSSGASGGGAVDSVNGQTGVVVLDGLQTFGPSVVLHVAPTVAEVNTDYNTTHLAGLFRTSGTMLVNGVTTPVSEFPLDSGFVLGGTIDQANDAFIGDTFVVWAEGLYALEIGAGFQPDVLNDQTGWLQVELGTPGSVEEPIAFRAPFCPPNPFTFQQASTSTVVYLLAGAQVSMYVRLASFLPSPTISGIVPLAVRVVRLSAPVIVPACPNDNWSDATDLGDVTTPGQVTGSNVAATFETSEPQNIAAGAGPVHSVWWKFTAPANGTIDLDTIGSTRVGADPGHMDTIIAAYTGVALDALTEIASDDDDGTFHTSKITAMPVTADTTYYVSVDGYDESVIGDILLNWTFTSS